MNIEMLRLTNCLSKLTLAPFSGTTTQTRWKRKPIWLGTAKSKLFRVPKRPQIPLEEKEELKRLFNNYRTQMKSLNKYLTDKYAVSLHATTDFAQQQKEAEEDFIRCQKLNNDWNAEVQKSREARIGRELEIAIEEAKKRIAAKEAEKQAQLLAAEELIRKQKQISHTFITRENIDEAIEKAISSEVDYNFAIDLDGNKIVGRTTSPSDDSTSLKKEKAVQL